MFLAIVFGIIFYVYFGYPILIWVISWVRPKDVKKGDIEPSVSVFIPAYNEEQVIAEKIENCLGIDYPPDRLEIVVATDGCTDRTVEIVRGFADRGVKLFEYPRRRGKVVVLNDTVPKLSGKILVITDASGLLQADAIRKMVRNFAGPRVGCVCARYVFGKIDDSPRGRGERLYVDYEIALKIRESRTGNIIGVHGALYAIRKELFEPLREGTINEDYILPMKIIGKGYRSVYEEEALLFDQVVATEKGEFNRRVRIGIGNFQQILELRHLLHPHFGLIAFQFFSHKVLRAIMPLLLLVAAVTILVGHGALYLCLKAVLLAFLICAGMGWVFKGSIGRFPFFAFPFYFVMANLAGIVAFAKALSGEKAHLWEKSEE